MSLLEIDDDRSNPTSEQVRSALSDADAAARAAGVELVELTEIDDLRRAASLFSRVWEMRAADQGDPKVPVDLLRALSHAGSYVGGAIAEGSLVGASLGFARLDDTRPSLHSHITGVLPGSAGSGVGRALKLHQRHWALERDVREIFWTFDPLVRRNAYFNVSKLGARIVGYYENFYGPMPDGLNHRDESDRCLARWDLLDDRVSAAIDGRRPTPTAAAGAVLLGPDRRVLPVQSSSRQPARVWVPEDIVALRRTDPAAALVWRRAVRDSLGTAIDAGWSVTSVSADGWFDLDPPSGGSGVVASTTAGSGA